MSARQARRWAHRAENSGRRRAGDRDRLVWFVTRAGSPIVTTIDGRSDPIVWVVGAEGDNRLHAFRGDDGEPLTTSPEAMRGMHHFQTLIAAGDRLYVAADSTIYAFAF